MKQISLFLLTLILLTISTGCSKIVYAGFAKTPVELKGAISIATNKPIVVTVISDTTTVTKMDLGSMIAVRRADLALLIKRSNELKRI
ncbi:MAG: hypothetical protein D4S01_04375 [Dehalococcoidia bacterium]|nr:MAG: hypothetical protein D4S01_04375 [Dehalococcoidia bacterium]